MDEYSRTTGGITHRFLRGLGIGGLAAIASLGLAGRVNATYLHSDHTPAYAEKYNAGDYIGREWYYLLDDGQYYYLDKGQYNLLGELGYLLGHPCYPKLFEREVDQAVGFTNKVNTGWFSFGGGQVPISEYAVWSYHFNAGDYIDRGRYYFLDKVRGKTAKEEASRTATKSVPRTRTRGQDSVKSLMTQARYSLKMPKKATSFHILALAYIFGHTKSV